MTGNVKPTSRRILYTSAQLANMLIPSASAYRKDHVACAFEEIAKILIEVGRAPKLYHGDIIREVREMNMHRDIRNRIVASLCGIRFCAEWVPATFDAEVAGFRIWKLRKGK